MQQTALLIGWKRQTVVGLAVALPVGQAADRLVGKVVEQLVGLLVGQLVDLEADQPVGLDIDRVTAHLEVTCVSDLCLGRRFLRPSAAFSPNESLP